MNRTAISNFARVIVRMLVEREYKEIEQVSRGNRLSADVMEQAVVQYRVTLVMPPEEAFDRLDVIEVDNSNPKRYSVDVDLYSLEEGRSDLTLEMTLIEKGSAIKVEIDDIHVL